MENDRNLQKKENERYLREREEEEGVRTWQIIGGAALILGGFLIAVSLRDIKRYIRIRNM